LDLRARVGRVGVLARVEAETRDDAELVELDRRDLAPAEVDGVEELERALGVGEVREDLLALVAEPALGLVLEVLELLLGRLVVSLVLERGQVARGVARERALDLEERLGGVARRALDERRRGGEGLLGFLEPGEGAVVLGLRRGFEGPGGGFGTALRVLVDLTAADAQAHAFSLARSSDGHPRSAIFSNELVALPGAVRLSSAYDQL